jgi:AcrR family transcriptional regulator
VPKSGSRRSSREDSPTLRSEQVAQTRSALVAAGRRLFGEQGFADTSVEDLASEARVTTGALYHHFSTKTQLFEAVFEQAHAEMSVGSGNPAQLHELIEQSPDVVELLAAGFDAFLDAVLKPDLQRVLIIDGPAVLGLARFTELDERDAFETIVTVLEAGVSAGRLSIDDPPTMARLLLGVAVRGATLIANSPQPVETSKSVAQSFRALLTGLVTPTH